MAGGIDEEDRAVCNHWRAEQLGFHASEPGRGANVGSCGGEVLLVLQVVRPVLQCDDGTAAECIVTAVHTPESSKLAFNVQPLLGDGVACFSTTVRMEEGGSTSLGGLREEAARIAQKLCIARNELVVGESASVHPEVLVAQAFTAEQRGEQGAAESDAHAIKERGFLRLRVISWNMQAKDPPSTPELRQKLLCPEEHDLIVIGTEECENTIAMSALNPSKQKWEGLLKVALGEEFDMVCGHSLQATHCIVFARTTLLPFIRQVSTTAVSTGIGIGSNRLGNKGGIGVSMRVGNKSFLFINAHLAHAKQGLGRRNEEYWTISSQISRDLAGHNNASSSGAEPSDPVKSLFGRYDYLFWGGDLNYRLDLERKQADDLLKENRLDALLEHDQLAHARDRGEAFEGLSEPAIQFLPTYKYDANTDVFDTSKKQRVPSWTDRVMYKASPALQLIEYSSVQDLRISDHRPVYLCTRASVVLSGEPEDRKVAQDSVGKTTSEVCLVM